MLPYGNLWGFGRMATTSGQSKTGQVVAKTPENR
jgi:hypothetical protein